MIAGDKDRLNILCDSSLFPHKEKVLGRIASGGEVEWGDGDGVPVKSMLEIYTRRLNRGRDVYRNSEHANRLLSDTAAYVNELQKVPDDRVRLWHVQEDNVFSYVLFEGIESKRILGCIFVADKRMVSPEQWDDLWETNEDK